MRLPADIALYDEFGQTVLLAEVKALPETNPRWAAEERRDVLRLTRGFVPPYFFVIARDLSYLWTSAAAPDALPDASISTQELFREYFDDIRSSSSDLPDSALELLAGIWLLDLTQGSTRAGGVPPQLSKLAAAAENGRIQFANAA